MWTGRIAQWWPLDHTVSAEDDLTALLADLHARQAELRERYVTTLGGGRHSIFSDLIYVKA